MIRFVDVSKDLGGRSVLDGVSFEIRKGETFVILGSSGAGKSVSLKHMVRLLTPDRGQVWVGDDLVSDARGRDLERVRARFGFLFQSAALLQWLTVGENVALPLREHTRLGDAEIRDRVMEKLRLVNLEADYDKLPSELSGGMRKRVGLARAIVHGPEIILYDEPTSGLDPVTSRTIDRLIDSLRQDLGVTSVVVTHDLHSALAIGTRIAVLNRGQIVEVSTPQEFVHSKDEFVRSFLEAQYITRAGEWEDPATETLDRPRNPGPSP
jgi:phospholipid/cholesterol/gamma-HCH transport system ATP-binding protein